MARKCHRLDITSWQEPIRDIRGLLKRVPSSLITSSEPFSILIAPEIRFPPGERQSARTAANSDRSRTVNFRRNNGTPDRSGCPSSCGSRLLVRFRAGDRQRAFQALPASRRWRSRRLALVASAACLSRIGNDARATP